MLTEAELDEMRDVVEDTLGGDPAGAAGTAIVYRKTRTPDGIGGSTWTWAAQGTADCRYAPRGDTEDVVGGAPSGSDAVVVTLPYDVDVELDDRVQIAGVDYEVRTVNRHSWAIVTRVDAEAPRQG